MAETTTETNRLAEMIRLGRRFLLPDHPTTYKEVRHYRRMSRRGLIGIYGADHELLDRFERQFRNATHPYQLLGAEHGTVEKNLHALDAAGTDAVEALNQAALEGTLDILREAIRRARARQRIPVVAEPVAHALEYETEAEESEQSVAGSAKHESTILNVGAPQNSPTNKPTKHKPGPKPDHERYSLIAAVVARIDPNWEQNPCWKANDKLDEICEDLDAADIKISKRWKNWDSKPKSWITALAEVGEIGDKQRSNVIKAIEHALKQAKQNPLETPSKFPEL